MSFSVSENDMRLLVMSEGSSLELGVDIDACVKGSNDIGVSSFWYSGARRTARRMPFEVV